MLMPKIVLVACVNVRYKFSYSIDPAAARSKA